MAKAWLIGVYTEMLNDFKAKTLPFELSKGWKFEPSEKTDQ